MNYYYYAMTESQHFVGALVGEGQTQRELGKAFQRR